VYVARIGEVNGTLHMVTELNPDALAIAEELDDERAQGKLRGCVILQWSKVREMDKANKTRPLHGLPIVIKGNIGTLDKLSTTGKCIRSLFNISHVLTCPAGSYALLGATLPSDSTIAAKLRQAGLIILGKTNLSQWANFRSFNSTNGWSAYGGQTFGAYFPRQDPSGSSSGSGVSSDLGLAFAALGTEVGSLK
jgi:amidase